MFQTYEPLAGSKHQDLRFSPQTDFGFASRVSAVKIAASEFRIAARFYPIIFPMEGPCVPQVLLSFEAGKNLYLNDTGGWTVPYVPAFLRLYPFTLARVKGQEGQFALCLDPGAPHFESGMGEPLLSLDGTPTEYVRNNIMRPLELYHNDLDATDRLFKVLTEKSLITERTFKVNINGEEKAVNGFKGVDLKKLGELDDQSLATMVRNGTIGLLHEHVNSWSNIKNLLVPGPSAG